MPEDTLWIPDVDRTTASPTGKNEYVHYGTGGLSWGVPYLAGVYALAVQVDPGFSPQEFIRLAMETGDAIQLEHAGQTIRIGPVINPARIIEEVEEAVYLPTGRAGMYPPGLF